MSKRATLAKSSSGGRKRVSVVMPYYENHGTLAACLESFCGQGLDPTSYEIVVVDDGSPHPAQAVIEGLSLPVSLRVVQGAHRGQTAATNAGIREAQGEIIFLTCADIIASPQLLRTHLQAHEKASEPLGVGGYIPYPEHLRRHLFLEYLGGDGPQFAFGHIRDPDAMEPCFVYAPNFSARRTSLFRVGLFDERFSYGCQDWDLGVRLAARGVRLQYKSEAVGFHEHPVTLQQYIKRQRKVAPAIIEFAKKHQLSDMVGHLRRRIEGSLPHLADIPRFVEKAGELEAKVPTLEGVFFERHKRLLFELYETILTLAQVEGFVANAEETSRVLRMKLECA